jgi:transaldolase
MSEENPTKRSRVESDGNVEQISSSLDELSKFTVLVADTGEVESIKKFSPQDATTNPSLILKAASLPEYQNLLQDAVSYASKKALGSDLQTKIEFALDKVAVNFGVEISKIVPGYVSTEVDARLSFDTAATVERARRIISMVFSLGSFT